MKVITFTCRHCGEKQKRNPRLKIKQKYCSKSACQRARKAGWKRDKILTDPSFAEAHRAECSTWRDQHPEYWQNHRQNNPEQTQRNRSRQRLRNAMKRRRSSDQKIAKVDAFDAERVVITPRNGEYWLVPLIAKVDSLKVNLTVIAG